MNNLQLSPIRQMALEIYGGCNYKCQMCPQDGGRHHDFLKKMPYEVFEKIIVDGAVHGCTTVSLHGSGEATLHPEMPNFVKLVKQHGMQCITVTNGFRLDERLAVDLIEAGIDHVRVSGIGYDRDSYIKWMRKDAFDLVRNNVRRFEGLSKKINPNVRISLYHLILDPSNERNEIELYKKNWVEYCGGINAEIWSMHNWSGVYEAIPVRRNASSRRSCGRPNSPYLNVRAGGVDGHVAAVVPCCFVLGRDERAILGNLDTQSIQEVLNGEEYQKLRKFHASGEFDQIDYCKNCDQLFDTPESLVWTNIDGKEYGQSKVLQDLDYRKWAT